MHGKGDHTLVDKKRITIRDVAKKAGVSIATVSRFLNNSGYIDKQTAYRIKEVIDYYDYRPSRIAQGLKSKRSLQIILVVPDICNPFYASMYKAVQKKANKKGYNVILYNTNEDKNEEIEAIKLVTDIRADGMIFSSIDYSEEVLNELIKVNVPVVGRNLPEGIELDNIRSIKGEGMYMTTKYLIGLGHKAIAYAGGSRDSKANRNKKYGYDTALDEAGIEHNSDYYFEMGFSMEEGYKAGRYFSTLDSVPSAICAANDLIAMGIIIAFTECGIRVPDDVSVTGMDNIEYSALIKPSLTTVTNDSLDFGNIACQMLFDRIEGTYTDMPRVREIPKKLIVRESTKRI